MFIIFGILGTIIVLFGEAIAGFNFDFSFFSLSIIRVIPIGALMIGGFIGWMVAMGVKISNKEPKKKIYPIFAAILALVTFFGLWFLEYKTTYVSDDYEINRDFKGTPISEFVYTNDKGEDVEMTFVNYTKYALDNYTTIIESRSSQKDVEVDTRGTENYINYVVSLLGMVIVGGFFTIVTLYDEIYCDNCNVYYKKKRLFKFSGVDYDREVNEFIEKIDSRVGLYEYLSRKRSIKGSLKARYFYVVEMRYCKECYVGEIVFKRFNQSGNGSGKIEGVGIEVDNSLVNEILTYC